MAQLPVLSSFCCSSVFVSQTELTPIVCNMHFLSRLRKLLHLDRNRKNDVLSKKFFLLKQHFMLPTPNRSVGMPVFHFFYLCPLFMHVYTTIRMSLPQMSRSNLEFKTYMRTLVSWMHWRINTSFQQMKRVARKIQS